MLKAGRRRHSDRGMSLVELMVGIAVGLFVVAAAALMVSGQLTENRKLLLETQLQQDLRATLDIITRDLRRAGYNNASENLVPPPSGSQVGQVSRNPFDVLTMPTSSGEAVRYQYRRKAGSGYFGFRLDSDGVIRSCQTDTSDTGCTPGWQELTDGNTMRITALNIGSVRAGGRGKPKNGDPITLPCPNLCPNGTASCWPKVQLREVVVSITGQSKSDASVTRQLASSIRIRNDIVVFSSAGDVPLNQACPSS